MAGFLNALGSVGGGFADTYTRALQQYAQQAQLNQQNQGQAAAGSALAGSMGSPFGGQQPNILQQLISKLSGAVAPQQQPAPQQTAAGAPAQQGGFPGALQFTLGQEGGYNPSDSNGAPSNFGVNQAANPDVNVATLTPQTAAPIYKAKYWDAIDGDNIPPPLQKMVFDTAVMSGPEQAKKMLQASGGDPQQFMQIRQAFQSKLLQEDPQKYDKYAEAWAKRNAALAQGVPQGGGAPGGQHPAVGQIQQMSLPQIIQSLRAQPGMTPQKMMSALNQILPVMNAQSQQDYRQVMLGLSAQRNQETQTRDTNTQTDRERGLQDREAAQTEKAHEFQERQARIGDEFKQRLDQNEEKIKASAKKEDREFAYREGKDMVQQQLAATRNEIYANSAVIADPKEQARLLKDAASQADAANKRLDDAYKTKPATASAKPPGDQAANEPVKVKTPAEAQALKPGTVYTTPDGQQYTR